MAVMEHYSVYVFVYLMHVKVRFIVHKQFYLQPENSRSAAFFLSHFYVPRQTQKLFTGIFKAKVVKCDGNACLRCFPESCATLVLARFVVCAAAPSSK